MLEIKDKRTREVKMSSANNVKGLIRPKFRKRSELSVQQLLDPDYRLKQLAKLYKGKFSITCSKCHHCRR